jgi:hypothetical protein
MPWQWHAEQQHAFDTLKEKFCQEPILNSVATARLKSAEPAELSHFEPS